MEFILDIFISADVDVTNVINSITQFCIESDDNEFVYSYHKDDFPAEDSDDVIILRGEYELMESFINSAKSSLNTINPDKRLNLTGELDRENITLYKTATIRPQQND